jgi:cytochrome P450
MRLYPPTWIYIRMARQTDRLPSGVDLPAGAKLYLCPWAIHRSARYFDDPLRFDPLRFTDENRKARPKYAYFPFGGGPRICIGQALAKMQMPLTLAALIQRFDFELLPDQHIKPDPKITLRPIPGIRLRLRQR